MQRARRLYIAKTAAVFAALPFVIWAFEFGPNAGYSGVPNENGTCAVAACHGGTPNSFTGSVAVTFPNGMSYTPGAKQHLVVTITDSAQQRWGFQLTARVTGTPQTLAGTFTPTDAFTQVMCAAADLSSQQAGGPCPANMPLQYIEHTLAGYHNTQSSPATYSFDWTPPSTNVGNVTVYVAANAANGNLQPTGDHIYTATYQLAPALNSPIISENGVANGAGYQPFISAGSWVTIVGTNLSSTTRTWRPDEIVNSDLPTQLDGVSVTINNKPAAVYYISPTQVNVLAPADTAQGTVGVKLQNNGGLSNTVTATMANYSPAFFLWPGNKYAVATRFPDNVDIGPPGLISGVTTVPAKPGDILTLWGTAFGPTDPPAPSLRVVPTTQLYSGTTVPQVSLGGIPVTVLGIALAPGFAGLYQVNVQLPDNIPSGDQKILATSAGIQSPDNVYINVQ